MSKQDASLQLVEKLRASAFHEGAHLFFRAADQIERMHFVNADLLEALTTLVELFEDLQEPHSVRGMAIGRAEMAIKKARGEA